MIHKKIKIVVLLFSLGLASLHAQEVITASGGNASGSGGTMNYTVGQIVYTTISGSNGSVANGVQQPYEISVLSGIDDGNKVILICSAYPNPTSDFVILKVENIEKYNFTYQLFDIRGKLLESKKVTDTETTISMGKLVPATYFLKISDENIESKTFKIIKN